MPSDNFIAREHELRLLRELRHDSRTSLAIIYGRRRIGKSALILEAYKEKHLILFEGLENRPKSQQLRNFLDQLSEQQPEATKNVGKVTSWHDALRLLSIHCRNHPAVVVFDELQWMANYRSELISEIKAAWDRHFSKIPGLTMILCGSVASFMVKRVVRSKALYGRAELVIHLKPFKLQEAKKLLKNKGTFEVLQAYLLVGGIPQYLQLLNLKPSIQLGIQELAFEEHGYFLGEFERIFTSHFGASSNFSMIVRSLGKHPGGLTRKQIAKLCNLSLGGKLSDDLFDLELASIISSYVPFHRNRTSRDKIYRLSDPYLRLYLNFIEPSIPSIEQKVEKLFINLSRSQAMLSWCGIAFELLCNEHSKELATLMGFHDVDYRVGPYFKTRGVEKKDKSCQVDLVFDRNDNVIIVCEVKYRNAPIGVEIIPEIEQKISLLPANKNKTIRPALITKSEATTALKNTGYFAHIILAEQLLTTGSS